MTSEPIALLLADPGVVRSPSRPKVSNDNRYSEAASKTLKYCPAFPDRFGGIHDARAFCHRFFTRSIRRSTRIDQMWVRSTLLLALSLTTGEGTRESTTVRQRTDLLPQCRVA